MHPNRPHPKVLAAAASLAAAGEPLRVQVTGACMAPLVADGATVEVTRRRSYWPGDVVAFEGGDGRFWLHRVVGYRRHRRRWCLITWADSAPRPDAPLTPERILGKVTGGQCQPAVVRVPFSHRLWALGRLARHLLDRLA